MAIYNRSKPTRRLEPDCLSSDVGSATSVALSKLLKSSKTQVHHLKIGR